MKSLPKSSLNTWTPNCLATAAAVAPLWIRPISNARWRLLQRGIFKVKNVCKGWALMTTKQWQTHLLSLIWSDESTVYCSPTDWTGQIWFWPPLTYCMNNFFLNWFLWLIGCLVNSQITNLPGAMYFWVKVLNVSSYTGLHMSRITFDDVFISPTGNLKTMMLCGWCSHKKPVTTYRWN